MKILNKFRRRWKKISNSEMEDKTHLHDLGRELAKDMQEMFDGTLGLPIKVAWLGSTIKVSGEKKFDQLNFELIDRSVKSPHIIEEIVKGYVLQKALPPQVVVSFFHRND